MVEISLIDFTANSRLQHVKVNCGPGIIHHVDKDGQRTLSIDEEWLTAKVKSAVSLG